MDLVLLWSGKHKAYLRPLNRGYTVNPAEAEQVPRARGEAVTGRSPPGEQLELRPVPEFTPADVRHLCERLEEAVSSRHHTQQWYSERFETLATWFRGPGKDLALAQEFWGIYANGTPNVGSPPTYAQMLNLTRYRAERAEALAAGTPLDPDDFESAVQALAEAQQLLEGRTAVGHADPGAARRASLLARLHQTYFSGPVGD